MLMFILTVSHLTTSNLSWFMNLTFQVPMKYCSFQHQTFLPSLVTSTAGCCLCFGSIPSFFLESFLHWSPVACWAPTDLGAPLSVSYHFAFSYCSWGFQGKNATIGLPFHKCHIIGIIQYGAFSDWLFSLTNRHLRFLHVWITHWCLCWKEFHSLDAPQFIYPLTYWRSSSLFPSFENCE